jgi:hypothetical protein
MLCSIIWQVLQLEYSLTCFKSYFNKWKKLSIGIDFGIGIDQNSWYRYRYRYRPKKLVSPITTAPRSHSKSIKIPPPLRKFRPLQKFWKLWLNVYLILNSWSTIPVLPSMRFEVVGFSYQTQILQKSVPEHRTPPQIFFECAPLSALTSMVAYRCHKKIQKIFFILQIILFENRSM